MDTLPYESLVDIFKYTQFTIKKYESTKLLSYIARFLNHRVYIFNKCHTLNINMNKWNIVAFSTTSNTKILMNKKKCINNMCERIMYLNLNMEDNNLLNKKLKFPKGLKYLNLNTASQYISSPPNGLTHLTSRYDYIYMIEKIPSSLTHITINNSIHDVIILKHLELPNTVTHLTFEKYVCTNVDYLSDHLTYLNFKNDFNSIITKLPSKLTHLILGYAYNEILPQLPNSLLMLKIGNAFNKKISIFPPNLTHLSLGENYIYDINCPNLTYLSMKYVSAVLQWPLKLKTLCVVPSDPRFFRPLPFYDSDRHKDHHEMRYSDVYQDHHGERQQSVKVSQYGLKINIIHTQRSAQFKLPSNISKLVIDFTVSRNDKINILESIKEFNIEYLECINDASVVSEWLNKLNDHMLPKLRYLIINSNFEHKIYQIDKFPKNITHLKILISDSPIIVSFSSQLKYLHLMNYNGVLPELPKTLKYFICDGDFKTKNGLPKSLEYVKVITGYAREIPKSVKLVIFS